MNNPADTISLFKKQYEAQAGRAYFASNPDEAVDCVKQIFSESKLSRPVLAPLPITLAQRLTAFFEQRKLDPVSLTLNSTSLHHTVDRADVGLSMCDFAVAFTGTVVEVTSDDAYRLVSSLPRVHIAFVSATEIVYSLTEATPRLRKIYGDYSKNYNITFISGPSRTADIEMKLFWGVHGPRESHVIVCDWEFERHKE